MPRSDRPADNFLYVYDVVMFMEDELASLNVVISRTAKRVLVEYKKTNGISRLDMALDKLLREFGGK
jgi:hypothetical protein